MKLRWLAVLAVLMWIGASAACGPECPEGQTNCGSGDTKLCVNTDTARAHCGACNTACKDGEVCSAGKCDVSCQSGLDLCEGTCVNTKTDVANCGGCGTKCKAGQTCTEGACKVSCPEGQTDCDGKCVTTDTDVANCGACGTKCEAGQLCNAGKCELSCQKDFTDCSGACVNTQADYAHCGACGTKCEGGQVCNAGKCETSCQKDLTDCSGACVDTKTNRAHCGGCGTACKAGEICTDGKCELSCADGATKCGTACVNTDTSRAHCGGCDKACAAGQICNAGKCEVSCPKDITNCSDKCVDLMSDSANCGKCGEACPAGEVCQSGKCEIFCQKGFDKCGTSCVDLQSNAGNCGKCGDACPKGQVCGSGKCVEACAAGELSCSNGCTNVANDVANCGGCGTACGTGEVCLNSKCTKCNNCPNWATSASGADSDYIRDLAVDAAGNTYAVGYFYQFLSVGGQNVVSKGSGDIFVLKANPGGKILWIKRAGGSSLDYGYGVAADSTGNVYITGGFQGTADFGTTNLTSVGSYDIFIAKLDKDGKWLWAKGYGTTTSDYGNGVAVDSKGAVYTTGYFGSTSANKIKFGTTELTSAGGSDIFLAKLDDKGAEVWAGSAGSSSSDRGQAITVDSKDNVYITGRFYSTVTWGTTSITAKGSSDIFVAKFDGTGKITWAARAGSSSSDWGYSIAVDAAGNVAVGGEVAKGSAGADFGTINVTANSSWDAFVGQLDPTGKWVWATNIGGSGSSDYAYGVGIDSKGNVWATGAFSGGNAKVGTVELKPSSGTSAEGFLAQFDKTGKFLGAMNFGGSGSDYAYGLGIDAKDNVYIGGYGSGVMDFGKTQVLANGTEIFIARFNARTEPLCPGKSPVVCNNACTDVLNDATNCGQCATLCPAGNICSGGKCLAPPANIYLQEINVGFTDYIGIKNYGTTDVNIGGLEVVFYGTSTTGSVSNNDGTMTIPSFTLKAGATVLVIDSSTTSTGELSGASDDVDVFSSDSQVAVLLCFGKCDGKKAGNVLDAVVIGKAITLPTGVTFGLGDFLPAWTSSNYDSSSYLRTGTTGKAPNFKKADWSQGAKTR